LYNQNAHRLRSQLIGRPGVVVLDVPYSREIVNTRPPDRQTEIAAAQVALVSTAGADEPGAEEPAPESVTHA
jgi:hypothetical protein